MSQVSLPPYGTPPNFPWDPALKEGPANMTSNPHGYWDGRYGPSTGDNSDNLNYPNCRLTEPLYLCSLCGEDTTPNPEGLTKLIIVLAHLALVVVPIFGLWCIYVRIDTLKKRVYSPFLLMVGMLCLSVGSMPEIDSHYMTMDWNSCYDTADTKMKLFFYMFVSMGYTFLTIGYRKANIPLVRIPSKGFLDWATFGLDWILIILSTIGVPIIWYTLGKKRTLSAFVIVQCISAVLGIPRIVRNLGPSRLHLILAPVAQLMAVVGAFPVNTLLQRSGFQPVHVLLVLTFGFNVVGVGVCIYRCEDEMPIDEERLPLIGSGTGAKQKIYEGAKQKLCA